MSPDLGEFADRADLIEALIASGPLDNQLATSSTPRPSPSICADVVKHRDPTIGDVVDQVIASLNEQGYWLAPLGYNTHPYKDPSPKVVASGSFGQTHVGDEFDTSPFPDPKLQGISIEAYVRNMGVLIRQLLDTPK